MGGLLNNGRGSTKDLLSCGTLSMAHYCGQEKAVPVVDLSGSGETLEST
jgi:hypothetical protein